VTGETHSKGRHQASELASATASVRNADRRGEAQCDRHYDNDGMLMRLNKEDFRELMNEPLLQWLNYEEAREIVAPAGQMARRAPAERAPRICDEESSTFLCISFGLKLSASIRKCGTSCIAHGARVPRRPTSWWKAALMPTCCGADCEGNVALRRWRTPPASYIV